MIKPSSYDESMAAVSTERERIILGGHYCSIKNVAESKSKDGKDMIIVYFDFAYPDAQDGYFLNMFYKNEQENKKWPFHGTKYIMVNDYADHNKVSSNFTKFCKCVEKSNPGFEIKWGDNWGDQFTNKKIGAVYGQEESEYNGKTYMREAMRWFCNIDNVDKAAIPEPKYLKTKEEAPAFAEIPDTTEVPF